MNSKKSKNFQKSNFGNFVNFANCRRTGNSPERDHKGTDVLSDETGPVNHAPSVTIKAPTCSQTRRVG